MRVVIAVLLLGLLAVLGRIGIQPAAGGTPLPAAAPPLPSAGEAPGTLFSPEDLNILEGPDRGEWQQPDRIMDALRIADGSRVADIGAGGGWFTIRLGHRVGPNGRVYAEDIQPLMIEAIRRRVERESLTNVEPVLGAPDDPRLPGGLDAVLIVDTFPQFADPVGLLRHVRDALAPGGRLGIVDFTADGSGGPGPALESRVEPDVVIRAGESAGLHFERLETFLRYQYMVIFTRPAR
ncbi:MAG: methyltransferase domain-containing protein [Vicinamibacterales bacterium]